jgi:hypothetical protein
MRTYKALRDYLNHFNHWDWEAPPTAEGQMWNIILVYHQDHIRDAFVADIEALLATNPDEATLTAICAKFNPNLPWSIPGYARQFLQDTLEFAPYARTARASTRADDDWTRTPRPILKRERAAG